METGKLGNHGHHALNPVVVDVNQGFEPAPTLSQDTMAGTVRDWLKKRRSAMWNSAQVRFERCRLNLILSCDLVLNLVSFVQHQTCSFLHLLQDMTIDSLVRVVSAPLSKYTVSANLKHSRYFH